LGGCVSSAPPPRPLDLPFKKYFDRDFDTVWAASVEVLDYYQIVRIDRDAGIIETDWTEARFNRALYDPPPDYKELLEPVKYRLKVKVSKLRNKQTGLPSANVQIVKELMEGRTFIFDYERIPTDSIEEQVLLYRIGQRVEILMRLKRKSLGAKSKDAGGPKLETPVEDPVSSGDPR
jgi:hypothetical protein